MEVPSSENNSTPLDRKFMDFIQRGDDFFKIELWRPAKKWYQRALELNIDSDRVMRKIAECDKFLAFEIKVIWILAAIAAVLVSSCILYSFLSS